MQNVDRDTKFQVLISGMKVSVIASSTNASPIEITTSGSHGLVTGDKVTIFGHTTNTAANGTWSVIRVSATKFTLTGSTGNGIGGATGTVADFIKPVNVIDFRHLIVSLASDGGGTADATIKCVGSPIDGATDGAPPDFAATRSVSNFFEYIQMMDKQSLGTGLPGDTGVVFSSADDYRLFEVNVNGLKWLSFLPTAATAGTFTIKLLELHP